MLEQSYVIVFQGPSINLKVVDVCMTYQILPESAYS